MHELYLLPRAHRRVTSGHLWIFSNEVAVNKSPLTAFAPGEQALVKTARGDCVGVAYVNPHSLICARLLSYDPQFVLNAASILQRIKAAHELRKRLFSVPYYRLCHGEGDGLPGLIIDRYESVFAVQITTAGMDVHTTDIVQVLHELFAPSCIRLCNDITIRELEQLPRTVHDAMGTAPEELSVPENGAVYRVPFTDGQKTGWFYDQRRNRAEAARYAVGARVLDAFSYVGGFGVAAAVAGATSVTFLDASARALEFCHTNLTTAAPHCACHTLKADALQALRTLYEQGQRFDVVSIDPPAFIKRRKDMAQGLAAYRKINALAMELVNDGGMLVTSSCSHHLDMSALHQCVMHAASRRHLRPQLLWQGTQDADHPIHMQMPETAYLKSLVVRLQKE